MNMGLLSLLEILSEMYLNPFSSAYLNIYPQINGMNRKTYDFEK